MTELEGREYPNDGQQWLSAEVPEWHTSIDALLRDIEPVCRERGMDGWSIETASNGEQAYFAYAEPIDAATGGHYAPTAATALARAFLAVLTRGER